MSTVQEQPNSACESSSSSIAHVSCSVCLEAVTDVGDRSIAKLRCGHHFHLDCIGSAFNAKGRMQCPNCRHVEQGLWLYGNNCFFHEDLIDDLSFEEDSEMYGGATSVHLGHTPWCPHQGSYAHLALAFGDLDDMGSGYLDPLITIRHGTRPTNVAHICPYLAAQGLNLSGSSYRMDDFVGLHVGRRFSRNTRRGSRSFSHRSYGLQQASAAPASSVPASFEGSVQNFGPNTRFLQPIAGRFHTLGFLLGSQQGIQTGVNQRHDFGGHLRQFYGPQPHVRNVQATNGNTHTYSQSATRNGYLSNRQLRQSEMLSTPTHRTSQTSSTEGLWINDYTPWLSVGNMGHNSQMLRGGWVLDNNVYPWTRGTFPPQAAYGSASWWPWVPPSSNSHGQPPVHNSASSAYSNNQFFSSGLLPRPTVGFSDQTLEGAYTWVFPRIH